MDDIAPVLRTFFNMEEHSLWKENVYVYIDSGDLHYHCVFYNPPQDYLFSVEGVNVYH